MLKTLRSLFGATAAPGSTSAAREATDEEKPAMWREMTSHWPAYDRYQVKTDRAIPVVVLERS